MYFTPKNCTGWNLTVDWYATTNHRIDESVSNEFTEKTISNFQWGMTKKLAQNKAKLDVSDLFLQRKIFYYIWWIFYAYIQLYFFIQLLIKCKKSLQLYTYRLNVLE